MKEQLRLLLQLQAIDARVHELANSIAELPKSLQNDKQNLARLEQMLAEEKARLAETEAWRKEQHELVEREDEAIRKAKSKLQSAKGSKEHAAASREVDNKRRAKSEREDELLKVMEALEKARAEIAAHEADVSKLRGQVEAEEARIAAQVAELQAEVDQRSAGRDELVAQLEDSLMKRYVLVRRQRGVAVAPVRDGVCLGCHMAVPPQLNNVLARGDSIESCPRCNRIIYREDLLDELATGNGDEATA